MKYCVVNAEGFITAAGSTSDTGTLTLRPGEQIVEVENPPASLLTRHKLVDGEVVDTREPLLKLGTSMLRKRAYPPIGDQLDVLWRVLEKHPELLDTDAQTMLGKIQAVKAKHPK